MNKADCRLQLRARRKKLTPAYISKCSSQVAAQLVHHVAFLNSQHIGYYSADEGEIDPSLIIEASHRLGKSVYLPVFSNEAKTLFFYKVEKTSQLLKNKFGILEPSITNEEPHLAEQFDLLLIPLVAFDKEGYRIGRGAGYYDRFLHFILEKPYQKHPILIGLGYEFQKVDHIVRESWDVPMDYIITEKMVYAK